MDIQKAIINVSVANVWTNPNFIRDIDKCVITSPVELSKWLFEMNHEEKLQLWEDQLIQTQVLYGESVIVIEENEGWSYCVIPSQPCSKSKEGYPGWIPSCQLTKTNWIVHNKLAVVKKVNSVLKFHKKDSYIELSFDTRLPIMREEQEYIYVRTPHGIGILERQDVEIYSLEKSTRAKSSKKLLEYGKKFIGLPYLWGGVSGYGYDCSGFVYSLLRFCGYKVPRDASDQYIEGEKLRVSLEQLQIGDLLYFEKKQDTTGRIYHVGIYCGGNQMLHAPKTGKSIEMINLKGTTYEDELIGAIRWIQ